MRFLYEAAATAAGEARRVIDAVFGDAKPEKGVKRQKIIRVNISVGYTDSWKEDGVPKSKTTYSEHLNLRLTNHVETNIEILARMVAAELDQQAKDKAIQSRDLVAAELARIEALIPKEDNNAKSSGESSSDDQATQPAPGEIPEIL